jgi:UDP-glucose 4-epimerase
MVDNLDQELPPESQVGDFRGEAQATQAKHSHVLVTGGAGYIGSHTVVELLGAGHTVIVVDNFANSSPLALDAIRKISGRDFAFIEGDVADVGVLDQAFGYVPVDACIHFAGLKAVAESVHEPMRYFRTNLGTSMSLFEAMIRYEVRRLVFSSSCTVYGEPDRVPITEDSPLRVQNPYGRTKLMIEEMLRDLAASDPSWRISLLRYFNPAGAHRSGELGEAPEGVPNGLMPYVMQTAAGIREYLPIFGTDYPTRDGTCVRDFVHVVDLARGHLAALSALDAHNAGDPGCRALNLGTGKGTTVFEMLAAAERASGAPIPRRVLARRSGDACSVFSDPMLANVQLGWKATLDIDDMCQDHWRWQSAHPWGFRVPSSASGLDESAATTTTANATSGRASVHH